MPRAQRRIEAQRRGRNAAVAAAAEAQESNAIPPIVGCPVLDPIDCQCPKTEVNPGEGVKMTCTSEPCPYAHMPLHAQCYQLLEDNLVKRLGTLGSARGWTVPQRRNNLWERKGQSLIGKFCRCRCGHGQMTRDKQALYEKEKAVEKEKKKKAKKAKQLPQLQFNSKATAVLEEKREGKKRDSDVFSPTSVINRNSFSTTTRSRLYTDRSTSSIQTIAVFDTMSETSLIGETSGPYRVPDSDLDDIEDDFDTETIIPAPMPPPQTKSYAATIKHEVEVPQTPPCGDMKNMVQTPDSGVAQCTPRLSTSDLSSQEDDNASGDHEVELRSERDGLNPLGLSILSSLEIVSSDSEEFQSPTEFTALTETPQIPKNESIFTKIANIRAQKSASIPKLPLAIPTLDTPSADIASGYGLHFNTPVRELSTAWGASPLNVVGAHRSEASDVNSEKQNDVGWTPFFGRGFNLGERLFYFP